MDDKSFHEMHMDTFRSFTAHLKGLADKEEGAALLNLASHFALLSSAPSKVMDEGPELVARFFTVAPHLAPTFPRDLLWYLGGECLHFMPDEEIEALTIMDEQRREAAAKGEFFNWRELRAASRGLQ